MSNQLDTQLVYVVDRDNEAAWSACLRICEAGPKSGQFIPLSKDEFEALKSGVIALSLPVEKIKAA